MFQTNHDASCEPRHQIGGGAGTEHDNVDGAYLHRGASCALHLWTQLIPAAHPEEQNGSYLALFPPCSETKPTLPRSERLLSLTAKLCTGLTSSSPTHAAV